MELKKVVVYNGYVVNAASMLNDNGELFYSCVTKEETKEKLIDSLSGTGAFVVDYQRLEKYGLVLIVSKIVREY